MTRPPNEKEKPHLHGIAEDPVAALPEALRRGPAIILVETQMGENIGAAARAMANFGLKDLRLVRPRDGWPNERARAAASRGDTIIDEVKLYGRFEDAIADLTRVYATTARHHDIAKPVASPAGAARDMRVSIAAGEAVGIVFGRERWGLTNEEVVLCDDILTIPVDPTFASLNIAQAVIICAYEWRQALLADPDWTPFQEKERSPLASKDDIQRFFDHLEGALDKVEFFRPPEKRGVMVTNLRALFMKARITDQEVRTLRGVVAALERRPTRRDHLEPAAPDAPRSTLNQRRPTRRDQLYTSGARRASIGRGHRESP